MVQRFCSIALPETAHFRLAGHRTGPIDRRHDPAKTLKDRRHGYGQHAPGLHSARFGISASARLRTGTSRSGRVGTRRGLNSPPRQLHRSQWVAPGRPVGGACPESIEIRAPTAPQPTGKVAPINSWSGSGYELALQLAYKSLKPKPHFKILLSGTGYEICGLARSSPHRA